MSSNIRINKICEFCGNDFIAQTIKTRFCSQKCGSKSYKARKRDMTNDVPEETSEGMRSYDLEVLKKQDFFTVMQCCEIFGISRRTIFRMIARNDLDIVKLGRRTLISKESISSLFAVQKPAAEDDENKTIDFDLDRCYTIAQAQAAYNISQSGLYLIMKKYDIKKITSGKYTYVQKKDLDVYLKGIDHE